MDKKIYREWDKKLEENFDKYFIPRLIEAMELRGMKQIDLAEKAGISRSTISNILANRYKPSHELVRKFAYFLGVSYPWLAGKQDVKIDDLVVEEKMEYELHGTNLRGQKRIRNKRRLLKFEVPFEEYDAITSLSSFFNAKNLLTKIVQDNSMSPLINQDDFCFYNDIKVGDGIFVFLFEEREYIRRLQWLPNNLIKVYCDNPFYESFTAKNEEITILGKVIGSLHRF